MLDGLLSSYCEHTRGHYLWFVYPCGHASQTKEVTRRHQLREVRKEEPNSDCVKNVLYTIDEDSFTEWQRTTCVRLDHLPCRKPVVRDTPAKQTSTRRSHGRKTPTPTLRANRVNAPTKGRTTSSRKSATVYNSQVNVSKQDT